MATVPTQPSSGFPAISSLASGDLAAISIPASAHTLNGFRQWALSEDFPERARITFADGELIIQMTPEYIETHNFIKTEITAVLYERAKRNRLGRIFSDGCLLTNAVAKISTEPDATFAMGETLRSGRCKIVQSNRPGVGHELFGTPDWVLEIASASSMQKDKRVLRDGYFRAAIREYWLVDALGDEIEFQILVPGDTGYVAVEPRDGWLASPTFGCSFRLTRKKDRIELFEYTLHIQENPEPGTPNPEPSP